MNSSKLILPCLLLFFAALSNRPIFAANSVSPDKQWIFKCEDGVWSSIVKADTGKTVLDLSNAVSAPYCDSAEVIWAPDSKHFAFNYSPPHIAHSTYSTVAFFELRSDKWVALPDLVDEELSTSQVVQLAKGHLPKSTFLKNGDLHHDVLKLRRWVDNTSAIVYGYSLWLAEGKSARDRQVAFLFTIKFDAEGNARVIKTERVPDKQVQND